MHHLYNVVKQVHIAILHISSHFSQDFSSCIAKLIIIRLERTTKVGNCSIWFKWITFRIFYDFNIKIKNQRLVISRILPHSAPSWESCKFYLARLSHGVAIFLSYIYPTPTPTQATNSYCLKFCAVSPPQYEHVIKFWCAVSPPHTGLRCDT